MPLCVCSRTISGAVIEITNGPHLSPSVKVKWSSIFSELTKHYESTFVRFCNPCCYSLCSFNELAGVFGMIARETCLTLLPSLNFLHICMHYYTSCKTMGPLIIEVARSICPGVMFQS